MTAEPTERVRRDAARVLFGNWSGHSTVPSHSLYPHQWSWDSAFIAIGLRHLSPRRAQIELESLLGSQWTDGRIPHISFSPSVARDAYFPGPDFWQATTRGGVETSGIVQPPVHALAVLLTHAADPTESVRRNFLARTYPKLVAWHTYLRTRRDLGGRGLVAIVHPWESGMDNSPAWDDALARVEPAPLDSFTRRDTDHASDADRPTDLDYGRYVQLAATYRDHSYDDATTPFAFALEDPCFNALLIASEHALAEIARTLGLDPTPHLNTADDLTNSLGTLFADGVFRARDLKTTELVAADTIAGLIPLLVPQLPQATELLATARGSRFQLGNARMVPSYDLTGPAFEPGRYWRGPSWFNTAWLVHRALVTLDQTVAPRTEVQALATALRDDMLALAASTDFAEYVDPSTGEGRGARDFSWTAALTLDLVRDGLRSN
ncbi:MGH1-like glycoside hydrolase domain-containing protein [Kribbella sp. NPDC051620]|uniref:MGH1-like glycoside hydrolase domain-containing protein n=1 Tax=Kribbella sp. NPDC051620 TaxID=3364120 RepID=UPI0037891317